MTSVPSPLILRPVPRLDGPYDDEGHDPVPPVVEGSLALAFPLPSRVAVPLRLVPPAGGVDGPVGASQEVPSDPRPLTARLAQAIAEVLAGARPPAQLAQVATLEVLHLLERNAGRLTGHRGGPPTRPRVASVHVSQPRAGVAEACAVVDTGPRRRALALRIEHHGGQWRCTAVHIG
jgi:hypothetical protein